MTLLSYWILITLLNFDTFLSHNSTGRRYVDGSEFHVELWPRVKIPRWIMTPGQNSTLNCDPNPRLQFNLGQNSTWNQDPVSQFNVESRPGVTILRKILVRVTIQRGIMTRGYNSTLSYDLGSQFNVESWPVVKISRWIMTRVIVPHWIMIQIPGHNWTLNHDPVSQFNVELRPGVIIQRGIKTWGHNSTGGHNFIRRRGRNTMTPCLGGSQFNMKNLLNPEHSPLNLDPTGRNSMGSKFNPTPVMQARIKEFSSERKCPTFRLVLRHMYAWDLMATKTAFNIMIHIRMSSSGLIFEGGAWSFFLIPSISLHLNHIWNVRLLHYKMCWWWWFTESFSRKF